VDPTLLGVIIGSGLSMLGPVVNQFILSRKEQKQWENQQLSEEISWKRTEEKKEKEYLREIYQDSLRSLSVFIALKEKNETDENDPKKLELVDEIHKWVTVLILRHSNSELNMALNSFASYPDADEANKLRKKIIDLSNNEESFFIRELKEDSKQVVIPSIPENSDLRFIQIIINDSYRKEQIIEGVEIQRNFRFECKLSEMSNSQREKLIDIYFQTNRTIPKNIQLNVPLFVEQTNDIQMNRKPWEANLNPNIEDAKSILKHWEQDFEKIYNEANQNLKTA